MSRRPHTQLLQRNACPPQEEWQEERRIEMDELALMRDNNKVLKAAAAEFQSQYMGLVRSNEMLKAQIKVGM